MAAVYHGRTIGGMRIAPQLALPVGGPDSIKDLSPPGAIVLNTSNGFGIELQSTAGVVTVAPYFWADGLWCPSSGDASAAPKSISANSATAAVATGRFVRAAEPRWWALLLTGAGTVGVCNISESSF